MAALPKTIDTSGWIGTDTVLGKTGLIGGWEDFTEYGVK